MYLNKQSEKAFEQYQKLSTDQLFELRKELDNKLYKNKFHIIGLDYPVPMHLNCIVLTKRQKDSLFKKSEIILNAIAKVVDEYYKSEELRELINIDSFERDLFLETKKQKGIGVMRLDSFWDGKKFQFVELNSDYPDAIALMQNAYDIYRSVMHKRNLLDTSKLDITNNKKMFYDNLMALYQINGGRKKSPVIAVVAPKGRAGDNEYQIMVEFLKKKGHNSFHVEPKDLIIKKDGSLFYKNIKIDIVRRAAEIRYFKTEKHGKKIFNAYRKNKIIMINDFHNRLWGVKSIFAILQDKNYQYLFNKKEIKIIQEMIPETYIISSDKEKVKNKKYWNKKDDFLIKPSDMSEAEGIVFGRDLSIKNWHELLLSKKMNSWIVQKIIKLKKRKVLTLVDNKKRVKSLYSDLTLHVFMDKKGKMKFGTIINRTSESPIVNVSKGGGANQVLTMK